MSKEKKITNFAIDADAETLKQFKNCYSEPYVEKAALMPDAHLGYVAPIGAVLAARGNLVPSWVGYDIGCGLTAARLPKNILKELKENAKSIYAQVKRDVPMGLGEIRKSEHRITKETKEAFNKILDKFRKGPYNKQVLQFLESGKALRSLGSIGSGNHFAELDEDEKGYPWIVVHSGSRGVGHWAAKFYMKKSSGKEKGYEETYPLKVDSREGKEYQNLLEFGLEFAKLNRLEIVRQTVSGIEHVLKKKIRFTIWHDNNHNHVVKEKGLFIHRKGATPAKKGERGIIPANMKEGSFLFIGKGKPDFIHSSSHGAGRAMSRREAKEKISLEHFKKEMSAAGVMGDFSQKYLDEAPEAYKNIYKVLEAQEKSIRVVSHLKPIINWK
jgi:tRNA-splicing ligase RtcB